MNVDEIVSDVYSSEQKSNIITRNGFRGQMLVKKNKNGLNDNVVVVISGVPASHIMEELNIKLARNIMIDLEEQKMEEALIFSEEELIQAQEDARLEDEIKREIMETEAYPDNYDNEPDIDEEKEWEDFEGPDLPTPEDE